MATLEFTVKASGFDELSQKLAQSASKAEQAVAVQAERDTADYVPASGAPAGIKTRTRVVGNTIYYPEPYSHYLYEGLVMVYDSPPIKITRPDGKVVLTHKGQSKHRIDKPLNISQAVSPKAQHHWFDALKAQNLDKWLRVADKAVKDGI